MAFFLLFNLKSIQVNPINFILLLFFQCILQTKGPVFKIRLKHRKSLVICITLKILVSYTTLFSWKELLVLYQNHESINSSRCIPKQQRDNLKRTIITGWPSWSTRGRNPCQYSQICCRVLKFPTI